MGNEQSTNHGSLRTQRDDEIIFDSNSITKPIGSDCEPSQSQLLVKVKTVTNASPNKIIVVSEGTILKNKEDIHQNALKAQEIMNPFIFPISNNSTIKELDIKSFYLEKKHITNLAIRYHDYLKNCNETISFDQITITARIKEVDLQITDLYNSIAERRNKFVKYADQFQKTNEILTTLNRIQIVIFQSIKIMDKLNNLLPLEDQLEKLTFD